MVVHAKRTFGEILDGLESGNVETISTILQDSWDSIRSLLQDDGEEAKLSGEQGVKWRGGASEAPQSPEEKEYVKDIYARMSLSWQDVSILLRDFLRLGEVESADLSVHELAKRAPVEQLQLFQMEEVRSHFGSFAAIVRFADDERHPGYKTCQEALQRAENGDIGKKILDKIQRISDDIAKSRMHEFDFKQNILRWTVELAFIYFYANPCSAADLVRLAELANGGRLEWSTSGVTRTTLMIAMTFVELLNLEDLIGVLVDSGKAEELDSSSRKPHVILSDEAKMKQISTTLRTTSRAPSFEIAIISFAWSCFLRLSGMAAKFYEGIHVAASTEKDAEEHLDRALQTNVLQTLPRVLEMFLRGGPDSIEISPGRLGEVSGGLVNSLFYAFPPGVLVSRDQLYLLCRICADGLSSSTQLCRVLLASEKGLDSRSMGMNVMLRKAQALFPLELGPFMVLIGALASDAECAGEVVSMLSEGIATYAEAPTDRSLEYPLPLEDEGFADAKRDAPFKEALTHIPVGVIVRSKSSLVKLENADLPMHSVGFTSDDMSILIWHLRWNGWSAIDGLLRQLLESLRSGQVLERLPEVCTTCYAITRICLNADATVRSYLVDNLVSAELIADILMHTTKRRVGLKREEKGILLNLLSSCLLEMVRGESQRAEQILIRLGVLQPNAPLLREISTFGGVNETALRNILIIAGSVSSTVGGLRSLLEFLTAEILPMWLSSQLGVSARIEQLRGWRIAEAVFLLLKKNMTIQLARSPTLGQAIAATLSVCEDAGSKMKPSAAYYSSLGIALELASSILRLENKHMNSADSKIDRAYMDSSRKRDGYTNDSEGTTRMTEEGSNTNTAEAYSLARSLNVSALAMIAANSFPSLTLSLPSVPFSDESDVPAPSESYLSDVSMFMREQANYFSVEDQGRTSKLRMPLAVELQDAASRCLSLVFQVLDRASGQHNDGAGPDQVIWPSGDLSASIRRKLAQSVQNRKSFWVLNMVHSAIVCSQRTVARALLKTSEKVVRFSPGGQQSTSKTAGGNRGAAVDEQQDPRNQSSETEDPGSSIIHAACQVVKEAVQNVDLEAEGVGRGVSAAVRLLRAAWEEYGALWLKPVFKSHKVWAVLRSLLIPAGSYRPLAVISIPHREPKVGDQNAKLDQSVAYARSATDEASEWRIALAHVIYALASAALTNFAVEESDTAEKQISDDKSDGFKGTSSDATATTAEIIATLRELCSESWLDVIFSETSRTELRLDLEHLSNDASELSVQVIGTDMTFAPNNGERFLGEAFLFDLQPALEALEKTNSVEHRERIYSLLQEIMGLNVLVSRAESYTQLVAAFAAANAILVLIDIPSRKGRMSGYSVPAVALAGGVSAETDVGPYLFKLFKRASSAILEAGQRKSNLAFRVEIGSLLALLSPYLAVDSTLSTFQWSSGESSILMNLATALRNAYGQSMENDLPSKRYVISLLVAGGNLAAAPENEETLNFASAVLDGFNQIITVDPDGLQAAVVALANVPSTAKVAGALKTSLKVLMMGSKLGGTEALKTEEIVLMLALRLSCDPSMIEVEAQRRVLPSLSGGLITSLLFADGDLPGYTDDTLNRNPGHKMFCTFLKLSAIQASNITQGQPEVESILQLVSSLQKHIQANSLDVSGDWPALRRSSDLNVSRHITLARLEEAEATSALIWAAARHTGSFTLEVTGVLESLVSELRNFIYEGYRLLRAEPIERWVLPVSSEEIAMAARGVKSTTSLLTTPSKLKDGKETPSTESAKEAIGRRYSTVPPSPMMPPTPMTLMKTYVTPDSGASPIETGADLSFSDEALLTLLGAMANALQAVRRYSNEISTCLFEPTMVLAAERASIGLLVAIQLHVTHELQRGVHGERRDIMLTMSENALLLTIQGTMFYQSQETLSSGFRDELRKRLQSIVDRNKQLVPPLPRGSLIHAPEMTTFLGTLK